MSAQMNEQFTTFTHQFAAAAARANRLALENAETIFGVQLKAFEKNIDATTAYFTELAEVRDVEAYKTVFPKGLQIAKDNGFSGDYIRLEQLICDEAERAAGKSLPVNATGAIGAISCELGLPWKIVRGIGVLARAIGLVGHILEESKNPMAVEIWQRVEDEATQHIRPQGA